MSSPVCNPAPNGLPSRHLSAANGHPLTALAAVWSRCKTALLGPSEDGDPKIRCPWCEGAKILYDEKSGLAVHCECCARTGFIRAPRSYIPPLTPCRPATSR